jgi:hypothetical protein
MVPQASYLRGENQAGVCGPGPIGPTASSAGSYACGDPSGGGTALLGWSTSRGSVKQEVAHHQVTERLRNGSPPFRRRGNPPLKKSINITYSFVFLKVNMKIGVLYSLDSLTDSSANSLSTDLGDSE